MNSPSMSSRDRPVSKGQHRFKGTHNPEFKHTLCFGNEEKRPKSHGHHERAKEHVRAVADGRDHVRSGTGDEETPEPLVRRRYGGTQHSNV